MSTRTYLLTPPGHKACKVSPGVHILIGATDACFLNAPNGETVIPAFKNYALGNYIAECMGDAPAWELIWNLVTPFVKDWSRYDKETIVVIEIADHMSGCDIAEQALAWLLRAGCAKEVVSP